MSVHSPGLRWRLGCFFNITLPKVSHFTNSNVELFGFSYISMLKLKNDEYYSRSISIIICNCTFNGVNGEQSEYNLDSGFSYVQNILYVKSLEYTFFFATKGLRNGKI